MQTRTPSYLTSQSQQGASPVGTSLQPSFGAYGNVGNLGSPFGLTFGQTYGVEPGGDMPSITINPNKPMYERSLPASIVYRGVSGGLIWGLIGAVVGAIVPGVSAYSGAKVGAMAGGLLGAINGYTNFRG